MGGKTGDNAVTAADVPTGSNRLDCMVGVLFGRSTCHLKVLTSLLPTLADSCIEFYPDSGSAWSLKP